MTYIRIRSGAYQVTVRKQGHSHQSKTFRKLVDARAWAMKIESEIERGIYIDDVEARISFLTHVLD